MGEKVRCFFSLLKSIVATYLSPVKRTYAFLTAATGKYYVIAGQHQFMAAMEGRRQLEEKMVAFPDCYTTFRCALVKEDVLLDH